MKLVRCFIAIDLPGEVRKGLEALIARAGAGLRGNPVRWVRPEGIHLTLHFLGDVETGRLEQLKPRLQEEASRTQPFPVRVAGTGCFPNRLQPRVLWVGVADPTEGLQALHRALAGVLEQLGFRTEDRAFRPHLTLGRIRREAAPAEAAAAATALLELGQVDLGTFTVGKVHLFQSELRAAGAVYSVLAHASLGSESV